METNIPRYRTRKLWIILQFVTYLIASMLILNNILPGELSIISGLLIPALFLANFLPESIALITSSALLTILTAIFFSKSLKLLLIVGTLYYVATISIAIMYVGSFN